MELKPTGRKPIKPLESIGAGGSNPWEMLSRSAVPSAPSAKRRNWARAALGATPPRDGPWSRSAEAVAAAMPIKTRTERQTLGAWPPLGGGGAGRKG